MAKIGPFRNYPMDQPSGENIKGDSQKEFKLSSSSSAIPNPIPEPQAGHVKEWLWNFKQYLSYIHQNFNAYPTDVKKFNEFYSDVKRVVQFIEQYLKRDDMLEMIKKETGLDLNESFTLDHIVDDFYSWVPMPGAPLDLKLHIDNLITSLADIPPPNTKNQ